MTEIVKADFRQLRELESDLREAGAAGLKAGAEQAEEDLRTEARPISLKLEEGVSTEYNLGGNPIEAQLIVSAVRPEQSAQDAVLHESGGEVRRVTLRPQEAYDFAEIVATGRPAVRAKQAKAMLIPVSHARIRPDGQSESFLRADGRTFVMRRRAKAVPPNPYDERARRRTEQVVEEVVGRAAGDSISRSATDKR